MTGYVSPLEITIRWGPSRGTAPHTITASVINPNLTTKYSWWIDTRCRGRGIIFTHTFVDAGGYVLWIQADTDDATIFSQEYFVVVDPLPTHCHVRPSCAASQDSHKTLNNRLGYVHDIVNRAPDVNIDNGSHPGIWRSWYTRFLSH